MEDNKLRSASNIICAMCAGTGIIGNGPTCFNPQQCTCKSIKTDKPDNRLMKTEKPDFLKIEEETFGTMADNFSFVDGCEYVWTHYVSDLKSKLEETNQAWKKDRDLLQVKRLEAELKLSACEKEKEELKEQNERLKSRLRELGLAIISEVTPKEESQEKLWKLVFQQVGSRMDFIQFLTKHFHITRKTE